MSATGTPSAAPSRRRGDRFPRALRLVFAALLFAGGLVVFFVGHGHKASAGEIFLSAADSPGSNTFTPSVAAAPPSSIAATALATPTPSNSGLVRANADAPGLYGGVRSASSCKADALVASLVANPARSSAWAGVLGLNVSDIRAFVATLTPVLLRVDTRVTDFGFADGRAVARQVVLQGGDAVLLDRTDFPRVRCSSGDPLAPPESVPSSPRYEGPRWPTFSPTTIVVITPAASPTPAITLIDFGNGATFARIPGSVVIIDINPPPAGTILLVVEPGQEVTLAGANWPPGTLVTIGFDNPAVTLGTATADGAGNVSARVVIPADAAPGVHQATISSPDTQVPQTVYVIPPAPRRG